MKYDHKVKSSVDKINVVQFGLGPIGINSAKTVMEKDMVNFIGAVDIDPKIVGRDVGEVLGLGKELGFNVVKHIDEIKKDNDIDIVLHTTTSFVKTIYEEMMQIMAAGANIVSSTEELFLPELKNAEDTVKLDEAAKKYGVSCLGTGVNPGYVMDTLATCLTGMFDFVAHAC